MSRTLTIENSRQTTLHEFCDLGIPKPIHAVALDWQKGYAKIKHQHMKSDKVDDNEGNEL